MAEINVYERIRTFLEDWGATRITEKDVFEKTKTVDFHTPFPGDQPIRSNIVVAGDGVMKATVRYGVLDREFTMHPTHSRGQIKRLKDMAFATDLPEDTIVVVNYGDPNREPRPHLLIGWKPSMEEDFTVVQDVSVPNEEIVGLEETLEAIKEFGEGVENEFAAEWPNEYYI